MNESGESLLLGGLTWPRIAEDSKLWRLKGGKHFVRGELDAVRREAIAAATKMNKAVLTLRDDFGKWHYLWVQYADYTLVAGEPCPRCASMTIFRLKENFGRCPNCQATFLLEAAEPGPTTGSEALRDLSRYTEVVLRSFAVIESLHRYAGYGVAPDGRPMMLLVDYYLDEAGQRIPNPQRPGEYRYRMRWFPAEPFGDALDVNALADEGDADSDETLT